MKKLLTILLIIMFCATLLLGCSSPSSTPKDSSSSALPSPSITAPAASPNVTPGDEPVDADDDSKAITNNGWVYYLDVNDPVVAEYNEDPPLHMKKADGTGDQQLGIRGFKFDIIGNYIYVDSNDPDLDASGTQTWSTTRMNLDGTGKKRLEYGSMSMRLIPEGKQNFYFTTLGDSAIFVSDFPCENVNILAINLPDKSELDKKTGAGKVLQLSINSVSEGKIDFDVTISDEDGTALYSGSYKVTEDGKTVEKTKGTYYEYGTQENE